MLNNKKCLTKTRYNCVFYRNMELSCMSQLIPSLPTSAVFPIKILVMNLARYLYLLISLHGHLCLPLLLSILLNCSINWFQSLKGEYLKISSVSTAYFSGSKVMGSFVFKSHEGSGTITCKDTIMETGYTTICSMFLLNYCPLNENLIFEELKNLQMTESSLLSPTIQF